MATALTDDDRKRWVEWEISLRREANELGPDTETQLNNCWDTKFRNQVKQDISQELRALEDFREFYETSRQDYKPLRSWNFEEPVDAEDDFILRREAAYSNYASAAKEYKSCLEALRRFLGRTAPGCTDYSRGRVRDWLEALEAEFKDFEQDYDGNAVNEIADEFRTSRERVAALGRGWCGAWSLGKGSFGQVNLWLKQDSDGIIIDRVAIKDSGPKLGENNKHLHCTWEDGLNAWFPARRKETKTAYKESTLVEVLAPSKLRTRVGQENVVLLRHWRVDTNQHHLRLYQEYCPHGDMFDFACGEVWKANKGARNYARGRLRVDAPDDSHLPAVSRVPAADKILPPLTCPAWVPEWMLWHTFESFCRVGLLFESGELNGYPKKAGLDPWPLIVHRDWKPSNIFLGPPLRDRWRGYPTPKVGDFGLSTMIAEKDKRKPNDFRQNGTRGCRAPEQVLEGDEDDDEGTYLSEKPSSKSDVYGAGMVLWSLMHLSEGCNDLAWDQPYIDEEDRVATPKYVQTPPFSEDVRAQYDPVLIELVSRCVRYRSQDRPTFRWLLTRIQRHVGSDVRSIGNSLRDANEDDPRFKQDLVYQGDSYTMYSKLADLAPGSLGRIPGTKRKDGGAPGGEVGGEDDENGADDNGEDGAEDNDDDGGDADVEPGGEAGAELGLSPIGTPPPRTTLTLKRAGQKKDNGEEGATPDDDQQGGGANDAESARPNDGLPDGFEVVEDATGPAAGKRKGGRQSKNPRQKKNKEPVVHDNDKPDEDSNDEDDQGKKKPGRQPKGQKGGKRKKGAVPDDDAQGDVERGEDDQGPPPKKVDTGPKPAKEKKEKRAKAIPSTDRKMRSRGADGLTKKKK